jgi:hypothetical protein
MKGRGPPELRIPRPALGSSKALEKKGREGHAADSRLPLWRLEKEGEAKNEGR